MSSTTDGTIIPTIWSNCSQLYIDYWIDNTASDPSRYGGSFTSMCLENVGYDIPLHCSIDNDMLYLPPL
jgi:hypothetical protein